MLAVGRLPSPLSDCARVSGEAARSKRRRRRRQEVEERHAAVNQPPPPFISCCQRGQSSVLGCVCRGENPVRVVTTTTPDRHHCHEGCTGRIDGMRQRWECPPIGSAITTTDDNPPLLSVSLRLSRAGSGAAQRADGRERRDLLTEARRHAGWAYRRRAILASEALRRRCTHSLTTPAR